MTSATSILNGILTSALTQSILNCDTASAIQQDTSLLCTPNTDGQPHFYEERVSCSTCMADVEQLFLREIALDEALHNKKLVTKDIDTFYNDIIVGMKACGLDTCKSCVVTDLTQTIILESSQLCEQDMTLTASFETNLSNLLRQEIKNNSALSSSLTRALNIENVETIQTDLVNMMVQNTTQTVLTDVLNTLRMSQFASFNAANGLQSRHAVTQENVTSVVQHAVTAADIVTHSIGEAELELINTYLDLHVSLNDSGSIMFSAVVDIARGLKNSTFSFMLFMLIVLAVAVVSITAYVTFVLVRRLYRGRSKNV